MPITIDCELWPLPAGWLEQVWQWVRQVKNYPDERVVIRCLSAPAMRALNHQFRSRDYATNVLTFSYPPLPALEEKAASHEVCLCLPVIRQEAAEAKIGFEQHLEQMLVHGLLHVIGLDHERSEDEARVMHQAEEEILSKIKNFTLK